MTIFYPFSKTYKIAAVPLRLKYANKVVKLSVLAWFTITITRAGQVTKYLSNVK